MEAVDIRPTLILWIKNFFFVIVDKEKKKWRREIWNIPGNGEIIFKWSEFQKMAWMSEKEMAKWNR